MESEQKKLVTLRNLKRLRTLKRAQSKMQQALGIGNTTAWVAEEEEEARAQQALLRSEARVRLHKESAPPLIILLSVSFKLNKNGPITIPLAHPVRNIRRLHVVSAALPHPLSPSFREGHDDCLSVSEYVESLKDRLHDKLLDSHGRKLSKAEYAHAGV